MQITPNAGVTAYLPVAGSVVLKASNGGSTSSGLPGGL